MEKICRACKRIIYEDKERYTHVENWGFGNCESDAWFHLDCFNKAMNKELTALEKQAQLMLNKASGIFNMLPEEMKPKEEYEIK